jgi:hypothetical protein
MAAPHPAWPGEDDMTKAETKIKMIFHATPETAREVHFSPKHSYHVQIPWDHPRCTPALREWAALYGTTSMVTWPLPVTGEPTIEEAIAWLEPLAVEALNARKTYVNLVMDAIGRTIRAGVDALPVSWRGEVEVPGINNLVTHPARGLLDVCPYWSNIMDAIRGDEYIRAMWGAEWEKFWRDAVDAQNARTAEKAEREQEEQARKAVEAERVAVEQRVQLQEAMVGVLQDEVDQARWEDGTMSELEARGLLRDAIFVAIECENDHRYERMRGVDLFPDAPDRVEFDASDHDGPLSRTAWLQVQSWRERCADGPWTVCVRRHEAEWTDFDGEDQTMEKLSVLVSYRVGPWTLSREYALDD